MEIIFFEKQFIAFIDSKHTNLFHYKKNCEKQKEFFCYTQKCVCII